MTYLLFSFKDEAIRYLYVNQQLVRPVHIDKFRKRENDPCTGYGQIEANQ